MPIEIRELHIRVAVDAAPQQPQRAAAPPSAQGTAGARDELVAECVAEVMRILRQREER